MLTVSKQYIRVLCIEFSGEENFILISKKRYYITTENSIPKMKLASFFYACAVTGCIDLVTSIKCYYCAVTSEILTIGFDHVFTPACSKFDGSSEYVIDCPYSTMCSRIISTMFLQKGIEHKTFTLGCAPQKLLSHVLYEGKWKEVYSVEEIYNEDCETIISANLMGVTKTYCYCRGDLCNSARTLTFSANLIYFLLLFLIIEIIF